MGVLELFAIALILYWLVYVLLWALLDSNVELRFKEHFGRPISVMRGQVVWITGASSGIGRALAISLAKNGVRLALSARREPELQDVRKDCLEQSAGLLSPNDVLVLPMDMLELATHQQRFDQVLQHFGSIDVLVNNAGRSQRASWEDIVVQVDRDLFELDVFSVMHLSRIVVRHFVKQTGGRGHLAVTSSMAGMCPVPFSATYCAAKHALNAYMLSLKLEHPSLDISIFAPGPVATNFLREAFTAEHNKKVGKGTENDMKRMSAERCGHLFAVMLANKSLMAWCGNFPLVLLGYIVQYRSLGKIVMKTLGKSAMAKIREGK